MTTMNKNQDGMVAIAVTMIIISLVTLITIGFATLVRRDQRQAMDRQLSAQAFYAAETGINDAVRMIQTGALTSEITDCNAALPAGYSRVINATDGVEYSCLLIDTSPDKLTFDPVSNNKSVIFPVRNANGQAITRIDLSWQRNDGNNQFLTNDYHHLLKAGSADPTADWSDRTSILRVDLIPVDDKSQAALTANTRTFFLYPKQADNPGTGVEQYQTSESAQKLFVDANCNTGNAPEFCKVELRLFNPDPLSLQPYFNNYYVRLSSIYADSKVTVKAFSSGNQAQLANAQALVDVTGKAVDVLRRLQVTVPLINQYDYPEFAIESTDSLCKHFDVWPATAAGPAGAEWANSSYLSSLGFEPSINTDMNQNACNPTGP